MKKLALTILPFLFFGCAGAQRTKIPPPNGMTVAAGLRADPDFDLDQDPGTHRSYFIWYDSYNNSTPAVALLSAAANGTLPWKAVIPTHAPDYPTGFEGRIAASSGPLYAVWVDGAPGSYSVAVTAYDASGKQTLPKIQISGLNSLRPETLTLVPGTDGVAYAAWQDYNSELRSPFVRIACLGPEGLRWLKTLGNVSSDEKYLSPVIADAGPNGVLAAFRHLHNGDKGIVVRRFAVDGTTWPDDVPVSDVLGYRSAPQIVHDGVGGAYVAWEDSRSGEQDIYAQHISSDGAVLWDQAGLPLAVAAGNQWNPILASDSRGGFFCGWIDDNSGSKWVLKVQHIDESGRAIWGEGGLTVCNSDEKQSLPWLVEDGFDGAVVVWNESRGSRSGVFAQRINWRGEPLWRPDGVTISDTGFDALSPQVEPDWAGGVLVGWKEKHASNDWALKAQRVDPEGHLMWR